MNLLLYHLQHKIKGTIPNFNIHGLEVCLIHIPEIAHPCYSYLAFVFLLIKKNQALLLYYSFMRWISPCPW